MNRAQRILGVVYLLGIAYCCVWITWRVQVNEVIWQVAYGWVWSPPSRTIASRIPWDVTPSISLIGLRLVAITALCLVAYVVLDLVRRRVKPETSERRWPKLSKEQWDHVLREFKRMQMADNKPPDSET